MTCVQVVLCGIVGSKLHLPKMWQLLLVSDSSLRDGLFHEYKKHGKVTTVQIVNEGDNRHAVVSFRKYVTYTFCFLFNTGI